MALICITVRDNDDGTVVVQMLDEPRCTPDQTEFSPAQHIGAIALNAIDNQLKDPQFVKHIEKKNGKSKLVLVGADELPL